MGFHDLSKYSQKFAAGVFAERGPDGAAEKAWFPAVPNGPRNEDGFTVEVENVFRSAAQFSASHISVQVNRAERTFTLSIPVDALSYTPVKTKTRFKVGLTLEVAETFTVLDFRKNAGLMEIEAKLAS